MKRSMWTIALAIGAVALLTLPALAGPQVSKSVLGEEDGVTTVVIRVSATDGALYGININDQSGSIEDIKAPKGWVGITSGERVIFRTGDKPIKAGASLTFRILTTRSNASLSVSFRDDDGPVGEATSI